MNVPWKTRGIARVLAEGRIVAAGLASALMGESSIQEASLGTIRTRRDTLKGARN